MPRSKKKIKLQGGNVTPFVPRLDSRQNPMKIVLILETMFKYVSVEDLANCRLVSKLWYDLSLVKWRSKALLTIKGGNGSLPPCYWSAFGSPEKSNVELTNMMKLTTRPYRRYRVINGVSIKTQQGGFFWTSVGPHVHELVLCSWANIHPVNMLKIIYEMTPNLKKLVFTGKSPFTLDWKERAIKCTQAYFNSSSLQEHEHLKVLKLQSEDWFLFASFCAGRFLSPFRKLEKLQLSTVRSDRMPYSEWMDDSYIPQFLQGLAKLKLFNPTSFPITHLDLIDCGSQIRVPESIPECAVVLMQVVKLSLKTLKLDIGLETEENVVQRFISLYANSLQNLVLIRLPNRSSDISTRYKPFTEQMTSLKSLELFGRVCGNLSFLEFTPNLEKLTIREVSKSRYSYMMKKYVLDKAGNPPRIDVFPGDNAVNMVDKVKDINVRLGNLVEFNSNLGVKNVLSVRLLGGWMPNLKKLRVRLLNQNRFVFKQICKQWQDTLEEITLAEYSFLSDIMILGWDPTVTKAVGNNPNIKLLKSLRVFRIEERDSSLQVDKDCQCTYVPEISDYSVQHGFQKLPELRTLVFESKLTVNKSLAFLRKKGVNVSVKISHCEYCDSDNSE